MHLPVPSCPSCGEELDPGHLSGSAVHCAHCGVEFLPEGASLPAGTPRRESPMQTDDAFSARYELIRVVGAGSMGVVHEARDAVTRRVVAVKFMRPDQSPEAKERFLREGRLMAQVEHPNLARIFDMDSMGSQPYLVMEFLGGGSLRDRMGRGLRVPLAGATRIVLECLDALAACHERKLVHRDVKPENILFDIDDNAHVTDLGVARDDAEILRLTRTGIFVGTPSFAAPEAFGGPEISFPADVYAMALIYFELLAGRPPLEAPTPIALISRRLSEEPPDPVRAGVEVPAELSRVIHAAMAREPAERPPTAGAFADAIRRVTADLPALAIEGATPAPPGAPADPEPERPRSSPPRSIRERSSAKRRGGRTRAAPVRGRLAAAAGLFLLGLLALAALTAPARVAHSTMKHRELVIVPSRTRARVHWETDGPAVTRLWLRRTDGADEEPSPVPPVAGPPGTQHRVLLDQLDPAGSYAFRLDGEPDTASHPLMPLREVPAIPWESGRARRARPPLLSRMLELPYRLWPNLVRRKLPPGDPLLAQLDLPLRDRVREAARALLDAQLRPSPPLELDLFLGSVPLWLEDPGFDMDEKCRLLDTVAPLTQLDAAAKLVSGFSLIDTERLQEGFAPVRRDVPSPGGYRPIAAPHLAAATALFPEYLPLCIWRGQEGRPGSVSSVVPFERGASFFRDVDGLIGMLVKSQPSENVELWYDLGEIPAGVKLAGPVKVWMKLAEVPLHGRVWVRFGKRRRVLVRGRERPPGVEPPRGYNLSRRVLDRLARTVCVTLPAGYLGEGDRRLEVGADAFSRLDLEVDDSTQIFWLGDITIGP